MKLSKNDAFLYFGTLILTVIVVGIAFDFHFFQPFDLQFHDTYIMTSPWQIGVVIFIVFAFCIFLIKGIKSGFINLGATWLLLIHNSLMIGLVLMLLFLFYNYIVLEALVNFLGQSNKEELIMDQIYTAFIFFGILISLLAIGEFLLIKSIIKRKKTK